ncbi:MAG: hypothetical protein GF411_18605 [Candidatus Lokiarchaeota archaeon]|nr:hypothetical protein [Candidatus Lokiarchaeota archaeon]
MRKDILLFVVLLSFVVIPQTGQATNTTITEDNTFNAAYENVTATYIDTFEVGEYTTYPCAYMDSIFIHNGTHIQEWSQTTGESIANYSTGSLYPEGAVIAYPYLVYLEYDSLGDAYFIHRYDLETFTLADSVECTCFGNGNKELRGLARYGNDYVTVQGFYGQNPNVIRFLPEGSILENVSFNAEGLDFHGEISVKWDGTDAYWITTGDFLAIVDYNTWEIRYKFDIPNNPAEEVWFQGMDIVGEDVYLLVSIYNEVTFESISYIYHYNIFQFNEGSGQVDAGVAANSGFSAAMGAVGAISAGVTAAASISSIASFAAIGQISLIDRIKALFNLRKLFGRKKGDEEEEKDEFEKPSFTPGFVGLFLVGVPLGLVALLLSGQIFSDIFAWLVALFGPIGTGWSMFGLVATILIIQALQRKIVPEMTTFGKILLVVGIATSAYGLFGSLSSSYLLLIGPIFFIVAIVMLGLGFLMSWNTYSGILHEYNGEQDSAAEPTVEDDISEPEIDSESTEESVEEPELASEDEYSEPEV